MKKILLALIVCLWACRGEAATFGNTSIGANNNAGNADPIASVYTAPASGTITQLSWYGNTASAGTVTLAVYSDDGGSPSKPDLLLASGTVSTTSTPGWWNATVSLAITNGTKYWLAAFYDSPAGNYSMQYDAGSSNQFTYQFASTANPVPSPWGATANHLDWAMSIYATYTAGGATARPCIIGGGLICDEDPSGDEVAAPFSTFLGRPHD